VRARVTRRRDDAVLVLAGLSLAVVCGAIARSGEVGPVESTVFRWINGLPDSLYPAMNSAQLLGVLAVGPVVAGAALVLRRYRLAAAALLVTAEKLACERLVWLVVARSRPGTTIADAIVRGDTPTVGASFVSGHVMLVSGLAVVVTPYLRGWLRIVPWSVVALVAFARMYLGAHAPLDVLGGFALGLAIGGAANLVVGVPAEPTRTPRPAVVMA